MNYNKNKIEYIFGKKLWGEKKIQKRVLFSDKMTIKFAETKQCEFLDA